MSGEQAQVPAAQGGAHRAHRAGVRRDRVLAGRERQAQADGHAQAVPEMQRHTPRAGGEGLSRQLHQRVQVCPGAQGGEVRQAEGRVRQAVVRAGAGVRVRLGRGEAAHRRQAGDLHHGGVRPLPQRGAVGIPVPPPGQPGLHGVAPQLLPRRARGAAHHGVRQHEGGRHPEAGRQEGHRHHHQPPLHKMRGSAQGQGPLLRPRGQALPQVLPGQHDRDFLPYQRNEKIFRTKMIYNTLFVFLQSPKWYTFDWHFGVF